MRAAQNGHVDLKSRLVMRRLDIADGQRLFDRVTVSPRRDLPDWRSVRQKDRLSATGIGGDRVDLQHHDQIPWRAVGNGLPCGLVQEILFRADQPVKRGFLWPVFGAVFAAPRPIALFDPQRPQRTAAHRPGTKVFPGGQKGRVQPDLIPCVAMQFPPQIAGKADPDRGDIHPRHHDPCRTHEPEILRPKGCIGQPLKQLARQGPSHVKATHGLGHAVKRGALWQGNGAEKALVIAFGHARPDDQIVIRPKADHGEIPGHATTNPDQGRQARPAWHIGNGVGKQRVQP